MKAALVVTLLAVVGVGGGLWLRGGGETPAGDVRPEMLYEVRRGDLAVTVTENGTLVAKDSQKVSSGTKSRGEITFLVAEGELVEQDEVLCRLDTAELEKRRDELERDIASANANLLTARTNLDIQENDNEASIEKAAFALTKAEQELARYQEGDGPNEKRRLEVAVKQKETEYLRAKKRYEDSQELFDREYINKTQFEEDQISYERAEVEWEGAKLDLDIFGRFTWPMTVAERANALTDARRTLENAENRATSMLRQKEVEVERAGKILDNLENELEETRKEIAKMTVRSPVPGIVLYGDPEEPWYRNDIKIGGTIHGRTTIFTIPDLRVMVVKLWIHEADINKLSVDLPAKVTMDTYPGVVLDAKVSKISRIAGSPDRWDTNPEVKRFEVDVTIDAGASVEIKPGISAKAEIFVEEKHGVLAVPLQCVLLEEGEHFVYVAGAGGRPERRAVKPGAGSDTRREVLEGLSEGDRVLLYNPNLPADAAAEPAEPAERAGPRRPPPAADAGEGAPARGAE